MPLADASVFASLATVDISGFAECGVPSDSVQRWRTFPQRIAGVTPRDAVAIGATNEQTLARVFPQATVTFPLRIIEDLMSSTPRFIANHGAVADAWKKSKIL